MKAWEWKEWEDRPQLTSVRVGGIELKLGDRVRLRPQGRSDIMDRVLAGKVAMIESIEQDYENQIHLAVVVDDDPGRDLGVMRQPGHRFFFSLAEVELPALDETRRSEA